MSIDIGECAYLALRIISLEEQIKLLAKNKKYKGKTTKFTKRISTLQTAAIGDYIEENKDVIQPNFTKEDEKKWKYGDIKQDNQLLVM